MAESGCAGHVGIMAKKKYYAVAEGRTTGIFTDWKTTEKQVKGFAGAKYKSFPTKEQADEWLNDPVYSNHKKKEKSSAQLPIKNGGPKEGVVTVYTDGGSINNPGPGGYGVVIIDGEQVRELSGGFRQTTNNRMEMMAAIVALEELQSSTTPIHLFSDSSYLVNGITKGWAESWKKNAWLKKDGQPALNHDLWQVLLTLIEPVEVSFFWIKGHAGHVYNERCDQLAVREAKSDPVKVDKGYEQP